MQATLGTSGRAYQGLTAEIISCALSAGRNLDAIRVIVGVQIGVRRNAAVGVGVAGG